MFNLAALGELYRHMEWADALIWKAVLQSEAARGDEKIVAKLRHLHRTQQLFLKVWRGETIDFKKGADGELLDELALVRRYYVELVAFVATADEKTLPAEMHVPWADYFAKRTGLERAAPTTLGETMFQAAAHSTYHRGQVTSRLREVGAEPPLVDYIAWLWLGRPAPEWP